MGEGLHKGCLAKIKAAVQTKKPHREAGGGQLRSPGVAVLNVWRKNPPQMVGAIKESSGISCRYEFNVGVAVKRVWVAQGNRKSTTRM